MSAQYSIIDTHVHLDFDDFDDHRAYLFKQMRAGGVNTAVLPGVSPVNWQKQIQIATEYDCLFALGFHPWYLSDHIGKDLDALSRILEKNKNNNKLVALGECGLDKLCQTPWQKQLEAFHGQISLADHYALPLMLHVVKSHGEVLSNLRSFKPKKAGVIHGFSGAPELAKAYYALGFKIGIGPLLLNANAKKLQKTVNELPLNAFVIETDLSQEPSKKPLESTNIARILHLIIDKMAKMHKKSGVLVSKQMLANSIELYNLQ
ncbi:TatD family hydrolase [Shewanella surugensis]|uniref:TatD family hydrolase n=1 Tax=Shewanella surugensis TaxID=212020 RepID=A0ABT0LAH8_9GAMM|nr:TatD family hydrolase [Shewanella surugensis]MCL1124703.1 TatD family hydrolase [Shewanella surugensis]